ncbi:hypothetical protein Nm8I071_37030 [Nonomuraea sp. TT08I-71]|nr:hypothetical protein Nm8I071_37030 [Nonomuraea sp. TT08I-71]
MAGPRDALGGDGAGRDRESGKVLRWEFDSEPPALEMVDRLLRADTAGHWREQDRCTPPPDTGAEGARRVT